MAIRVTYANGDEAFLPDNTRASDAALTLRIGRLSTSGDPEKIAEAERLLGSQRLADLRGKSVYVEYEPNCFRSAMVDGSKEEGR